MQQAASTASHATLARAANLSLNEATAAVTPLRRVSQPAHTQLCRLLDAEPSRNGVKSSILSSAPCTQGHERPQRPLNGQACRGYRPWRGFRCDKVAIRRLDCGRRRHPCPLWRLSFGPHLSDGMTRRRCGGTNLGCATDRSWPHSSAPHSSGMVRSRRSE